MRRAASARVDPMTASQAVDPVSDLIRRLRAVRDAHADATPDAVRDALERALDRLRRTVGLETVVR